MNNESKFAILRCPVCRGDLAQDGMYLICVTCAARFPYIDDIAVLLTKDDAARFIAEPWGNQLQEDLADCFAGFTFVSNEHPIEDIQRLHAEGKKAGMSGQLYETGIYPDDWDMPEELNSALKQSRVEIVELSRARSARRVLDWPTGHGYCMHYLANHVSPDTLVVALDISFRFMAKLKPYYDKYSLSDKMLFVVADARKMPFKDNVFQAATAWGGTVEIANAEAGCKETLRILEDNGWFGISGDHYKEDSPSMEVAKRLGLESLASKERFDATMKRIGFRDLEYSVLFEGYDPWSETPEEDRCPLPARGDWFQQIVASARK